MAWCPFERQGPKAQVAFSCLISLPLQPYPPPAHLLPTSCPPPAHPPPSYLPCPPLMQGPEVLEALLAHQTADVREHMQQQVRVRCRPLHHHGAQLGCVSGVCAWGVCAGAGAP